MTCFALLCALSMTAFAGQAESPGKRLYVEPFTTKQGSEKLRDEVISELRKIGTVSLASGESGADVILGGGGEIWVRGYRSLNPRAGESPANGTPVYGGFLSVELRDARGDTLWSWLATPKSRPGAGLDDIDKDLAKQIARHVAEALLQPTVPAAPALPPASAHVALKGAGATFPYPLYSKWFTNYRRVDPEISIAYEPVGSEAGIRQLLKGELDFAGSDSPEAVHQLAPAEESRYLLFPAAVGAVVPIVNLPGLAGEISFTPETLAGIYLGKIRKWNDPALKQANPRLHLPDLDIVVVHRSDGSGTSYVWTDFLSKTDPDWKKLVGPGMAPGWPAGRGAAGNEGVAGMVKELGGSIGYVEFIYALQNHLNSGKVRNRNGEFVDASLESIGIAARKAVEISDDLKVSLVDAPGAGAYPISSFTWLVVPAAIPDEAKRNALAGFFHWMLGPGQTQAAALGYLELPKELVAREEAAIRKLR